MTRDKQVCSSICFTEIKSVNNDIIVQYRLRNIKYILLQILYGRFKNQQYTHLCLSF